MAMSSLYSDGPRTLQCLCVCEREKTLIPSSLSPHTYTVYVCACIYVYEREAIPKVTEYLKAASSDVKNEILLAHGLQVKPQ